MSEEKKVVEMPEAPMETTKRELSDEARMFINNAAISIIKDAIPNKDDYNNCLCSIGVSINSETKAFDTAMINIFNIPQSTTAFVPVYQVIVDLTNRKVAGTNNFVAPVVFRKDENGNETDAVLLGRNGDIAITAANIVAEIMANVHDEENEPADNVPEEEE